MSKKNQGFTLVELLVTITVGALVTLAATTVILMGLRLNRQSMGTATRQNTARVLLSSLEDLASDGSISGFRMDYEDWKIYGEAGETDIIYEYDAENHVISTNGTPIMKDVLSSYLEYEEGLLTISVETEEGIFNSTVYCRMAIAPSGVSGADEEDEPAENEVVKPNENEMVDLSVKEIEARLAFINVLWSQYSESQKNIGYILENGENTGIFYSQWYITNEFRNPENWGENGWDALTPWCACYVSWAIAEVEGYTNYDSENFRPTFAGVDSFLSYFYLKENPQTPIKRDYWITADFWKTDESREAEGEAPENTRQIYPGDIIFLDWVINQERNPQHVGVVLYVDEENKIVYTIEGNVAASYTEPDGRYGTVGLRKYKLDDPRILGYGVLDWKTGDELSGS